MFCLRCLTSEFRNKAIYEIISGNKPLHQYYRDTQESGEASQNAPEVDDEGYSIRPADTERILR